MGWVAGSVMPHVSPLKAQAGRGQGDFWGPILWVKVADVERQMVGEGTAHGGTSPFPQNVRVSPACALTRPGVLAVSPDKGYGDGGDAVGGHGGVDDGEGLDHHGDGLEVAHLAGQVDRGDGVDDVEDLLPSAALRGGQDGAGREDGWDG